MNFTKAKFVALAVLAGLQINASATLLNPQEFENGGLTWLTLSETIGLSISDFTSGVGGWNTKYRFATNAEIASLVNSYGIRPQDYSTNPNGQTWQYIQDVGGFHGSYFGTWFHDGDQGAIGRTLNAYVSVAITEGDNGPVTPACPQYFACRMARIDYSTQAVNARDPISGLFLVEGAEVPEPSTLALFGIAGLAALGRRRSKAS